MLCLSGRFRKHYVSSEGFLGLTGYYNKFVQGYEKIGMSFMEKLKKQGFKWINESTKSFWKLQHAMTQGLILALPDFS